MPAVSKVCCIGAGTVGTSLMAVLGSKCPDVQVCIVDEDAPLIARWSCGQSPFFEPRLQDLVKKGLSSNLSFSVDFASALGGAQVVFVCLDTPMKASGIGAGQAADLSEWEKAARSVAGVSNGPLIVVECSTVPVGTAETLSRILSANSPDRHFEVVCLPAFMTGGNAVSAWEDGLRYLVGGNEGTEEGQGAVKTTVDLLTRWIPAERIVTTRLWSAELSKMALNALKAQRVAATFAVSAVCERSRADVAEVMKSVGMDARLGSGCMATGPGIGGPALVNNLQALVYLNEKFGLKEQADYWRLVLKMNNYQISRINDLIVNRMGGSLVGKRIAILGYAYKADTSDPRRSPAQQIAKMLLDEKAQVAIYDPQVRRDDILKAMEYSPDVRVADVGTPYDAALQAHAVVVATEWEEFKSLDWERIAQNAVHPMTVFDTRRVVDTAAVRSAGLDLFCMGSTDM